MNWDVTKHSANSNFESEPLTIEGIKTTTFPFSDGSRDCYLMEVRENVTYSEKVGSNLSRTTKKEIITFRRTYKQRSQLSDEANDAFYYFAHCYRTKVGTKISFKGYWFNTDFTKTVFCLGEETNGIIKKEKERWDKAGLTERKDLKIENIEFVDTKLDALERDINNNNWNPPLNQEEKKLINSTRTVEGVKGVQREIALLREKKELQSKNQELERKLADKEEVEKKQLAEIDKLKAELEKSKKQNQNDSRKITDLEDEKRKLDDKINKLDKELADLKTKNSGLTSDIENRNQKIKELENGIGELKKELGEEKSKSNQKDQKITQLQTEVNSLKGQIEKIQPELDQTKKDKEKAIDDYQREKASRERVEAELANYKKENKDLKKQIDTHQQSLSGTQRKLEEKQKELSEAEKKITGLEQKEKDHQKQIEELKKALDNAKNDEENKKLQAQLNQANKELQELREKKGELEKKVSDLNTELTNTKNERDGLKQELEKVRQELQKEREKPIGSLDEIIEQAKNAKSVNELETALSSLGFYRNSQIEKFKQLYEQRKPEVDRLLYLLSAKLQAHKDIGKALDEYSFSKEDIIPIYQDYAETIKNFAEKLEVENFAKEMIAYLERQKTAHQSLSDALKVAAEVSGNDKDQEKSIFEKRRQVRQKLDNLTEKTSLEAKQAYQVMNKEVVDSTKKLEKQIWDHLNGYKQKAEDPINKKFVDKLEEKKYVKGTKEFDYYWILWGIAEEFAKSRLEGKKVHLYPYVTVEKADGHTNWRDIGNGLTDFGGFDLYIDLGKLVEKGEPALFDTLMHELMHDVVMLKERKKELPKNQHHSKPFWEGLYYAGDDSTLNYSISCLPFEKQQRVKVLTNLLENTIFTDARTIYFPNTKKENEGKIRKRQFFKGKDIFEEWDSARGTMLRLTNDSMNEDLKNWEDLSKTNARWFEIKVLHPEKTLKNDDPIAEENKNKHKVYLFYNQETFPKLKKQIEDQFGGWEEKLYSQPVEIEELFSQIDEGSVVCGCGRENISVSEEIPQQVAQIIHNPPPRGNGNN